MESRLIFILQNTQLRTSNDFIFINTTSQSRNITMVLFVINEHIATLSLYYKEIVRAVLYCFMHYINNWNKICKKKYMSCVPGMDDKPRHRLCYTTPSGWIFPSTPGTLERYLISVTLKVIFHEFVRRLYLKCPNFLFLCLLCNA